MTMKFRDEMVPALFEQFDYQIVYMRPNYRSDERLAVGVVVETTRGLEARFVASVGPLGLMQDIFGEKGVEQFQFAAAELRQSARAESTLDELAIPTDLLVCGEKMTAITRDREGLLREILASSSCLVRAVPARARELADDDSGVRLRSRLYEQVSLLNPMAADDLFQNRRFTVSVGEETEVIFVPIFGRKIFGTPVSFEAAASDQKIRVEAYIAKYRWLRQSLAREPNIYVLSPQPGSGRLVAKSESDIRELKAVAGASDVRLRVSDSTEELASMIVCDEAA